MTYNAYYDTSYYAQDDSAYRPYPSPTETQAAANRPRGIKTLFARCRYYYLTNPTIHATITKMAEYPITDLIVESEHVNVRRKWDEYLNDHLRIPELQRELNVDYYGYGNGFVTTHVPITKWLICRQCRSKWNIKSDDIKFNWRFQGLKYMLKCPKCGSDRDAEVHDDYSTCSQEDLRAVRINPDEIVIYPGYGFTQNVYARRLPPNMIRDIYLGRRHVVESIPNSYIVALREKKELVFHPGSLYHFKRPIISHPDYGWGMPLIYPVLDDAFHLKVLRRGQEAIASQHIMPLYVLYPLSQGADANPYAMTNLANWREYTIEEIAKHRKDPNHIAITPVPIGVQVVGGSGRAMMLHQEQRVVSEEMITGMGVPLEFIYGGLQWSGTNISLKSFANQFLNVIADHRRMLNGYLIPFVAAALGWPMVTVRQKKFKMADDLQRGMMLLNFAQASKISDRTLLEEVDLDPVQEDKRMSAERARATAQTRANQLAMARIQGEAQLTAARYQAEAMRLQGIKQMDAQIEGQQKAQQVLGAQQPPAGPGGPGGAAPQGQEAAPQAQGGEQQQLGQQPSQDQIMQMMQEAAAQISNLPKADQDSAIQQIGQQDPQAAKMIQEMVMSANATTGGSQLNPNSPGQAQAPEMKPPRAASGQG